MPEVFHLFNTSLNNCFPLFLCIDFYWLFFCNVLLSTIESRSVVEKKNAATSTLEKVPVDILISGVSVSDSLCMALALNTGKL